MKYIGLIAVVMSIAACDPATEIPPESRLIDEAAIDDVWQKAKLRGVAFRAIGQEPGWLLEITNGEEILLVTDYGDTRTSLPYVEPVVHQQERRTEYRLPDHDTVVEIRGEPCTDSMSGEQFPVSVSVISRDRMLVGCGRALF